MRSVEQPSLSKEYDVHNPEVVDNLLYSISREYAIHPSRIKEAQDKPNITGGYGIVVRAYLYSVTSEDSGQSARRKHKVAVKKLKADPKVTAERVKRRVLREILVWSRLQHENVVRFIGFHVAFNSGNAEAWFISPWHEQGSVATYLKVQEIPPLSVERLLLLEDAGKGVKYLHDMRPPISHGDIKSGNVLVRLDQDDRARAVLCDFGLSNIAEDEAFATVQTEGEWSGSIMTETMPFSDVTFTPRIIVKITQNRLPSMESHVPLGSDSLSGLRELMKACWHPSPEYRVSMLECLNRMRVLIETFQPSEDEVAEVVPPPPPPASAKPASIKSPSRPRPSFNRSASHEKDVLATLKPAKPTSSRFRDSARFDDQSEAYLQLRQDMDGALASLSAPLPAQYCSTTGTRRMSNGPRRPTQADVQPLSTRKLPALPPPSPLTLPSQVEGELNADTHSHRRRGILTALRRIIYQMPSSFSAPAQSQIDSALPLDPFASLPIELIQQLLLMLHPLDIFAFSQTCKQYADVALADAIWVDICHRIIRPHLSVDSNNLDSPKNMLLAREQLAGCVGITLTDSPPHIFFLIYVHHLTGAGQTLGWWAVDHVPEIASLLRTRVTFKFDAESQELEYYFLTTCIPPSTSTFAASLSDHPLLSEEEFDVALGAGTYLVASLATSEMMIDGHCVKPQGPATELGSSFLGSLKVTRKDSAPGFMNFFSHVVLQPQRPGGTVALFPNKTYNSTFDDAPFPSPAVKPATRTTPGLLVHSSDKLKACSSIWGEDDIHFPIHAILAPSDFTPTPHDLVRPGIYIAPSSAEAPWEYTFVHTRVLTEDDFNLTWPWEGTFSTHKPQSHRNPNSELVDWSDPANHLGPFSELYSPVGAPPSPISRSHVRPGARILEVVKVTGNDRVPRGQRTVIAFLDDPLVPSDLLDGKLPEQPDENIHPWPLVREAVASNDPDPSHLLERRFSPTRGVDVPGCIRTAERGFTRPSWMDCTVHVESRTQFSVWWSDETEFVRIYTKLEEW